MTVKTFVVRVDVSGGFMRSDQSMAVPLAYECLRDQANDYIVGPRGGRYLPVSEVRDIRGGQDTDDYLFDRWSFVGKIDARYVRPVR